MANQFIARKGLIALNDSNITGSLSVSGGLTVKKDTGTAFEVVGSAGQLFSVEDGLTGSLFAVSDISGLPILEVSSDDKVVAGAYGQNAFVVTGSKVGIGTGTPQDLLHILGGKIRVERSTFPQFTVIEPDTSAYAEIGLANSDFFFKRGDNTHSFRFRRHDNTDVVNIDMANQIVKITGSISASGKVEGLSGSFSNLDVFDIDYNNNPRVRIGREPGQSLQFHTDDSINKITAVQDEPNQNHLFILDRVTPTTASNDFSIRNNGVDQFRISEAGSVSMGPGTLPDPFYTLNVISGSKSIIRVKGSSIGRLSLENGTRHYSISTQGSSLYFYDETGNGTRMLLKSNGNLGIGTTTPTEKLHVHGNNILLSGSTSHEYRALPSSNSFNYSSAIRFRDNYFAWVWGGGIKAYFNQNHRLAFGSRDGGVGDNFLVEDPLIGRHNITEATGSFVIQTNNTSRLFISSSGRVGISTVSPTQKFDVDGTTYIRGGTYQNDKFDGDGESDKTDVALIIDKNKFVYTKDGNIVRKLIGKTTDEVIEIGQSGTALIEEIRHKPGNHGFVSFYSSSTEYARFTGNSGLAGTGRLGIGTTAPASLLHLRGGGSLAKLLIESEDNSSPATSAHIELKGYDGRGKGIFLKESGSYSGREIFFGAPYAGQNQVFSIGYNGDGNGQAEYLASSSFYINLDSSKVGIGTTTPSARLHVSGGNIKQAAEHSITLQDGSNIIGSNHLYLQGTTSYIQLRSSNNYVYYDAHQGHIFRNGSGGYSDAKVGIGTNNPAVGLHVSQSTGIRSTGQIDVRDKGDTETHAQLFSDQTQGRLRLHNGSNWGLILKGVANSPKIGAYESGSIQIVGFNDSNGDNINHTLTHFDLYNQRVGIGTTSPSRKLHLLGGGSDTRITLERTDNDAIIEAKTRQAGAYFRATDNNNGTNYYGLELVSGSTTNWFLGSYGYKDFRIVSGAKSTGTSSLTVKHGTGNIGIGTDSPSEKLTVEGNISSTGDISAAGNITADILTLVGTSLIEAETLVISGSNIFGSGSGDTHEFIGSITASSDISASGTIIASKIHLNTPPTFTANTAADTLVIGNGVGSSGITLYSQNNNNGSIFFAQDLDEEGNDDDPTGNRHGVLHYNHTNSRFQLRTAGNQVASDIDRSEAFFYGNLVTSGSLTVHDRITELSAERFKENIQPLTSSLTKTLQLEGVSFNKIGKTDLEIGFIAEQVAEIYPEFVEYDSSGNEVMGIQYSRLTAVLLESIKELNDKVNSQQIFINDLAARIEKLENN